MLAVVSVSEQRLLAVRGVGFSGASVTDVARRYGVDLSFGTSIRGEHGGVRAVWRCRWPLEYEVLALFHRVYRILGHQPGQYWTEKKVKSAAM